jgi:hypothetical protein
MARAPHALLFDRLHLNSSVIRRFTCTLGRDLATEIPGSGVIRNLAVAALVLLGVRVHVWAGVSDQGHAVWRPVGHGTVFAMFAWLAAAVVAIVELVRVRGRGLVAWVGLAIALGGMILMLTV